MCCFLFHFYWQKRLCTYKLTSIFPFLLFSSFIVGAGFGAGIVIYFVKFRRPGSNGSPHYVSAKSQNLYVSLPMLDLKHKHLSSNQSDCGTLRSTSTLRSKANSSVYNASRSEYETATIKRSHSQSHRNSSLIAGSSTLMRADLDSDQLFTWNWRKNGHLRVISRVFFQKNIGICQRNFHISSVWKIDFKKTRRNIYGVLCYVFVYIIYYRAAMND